MAGQPNKPEDLEAAVAAFIKYGSKSSAAFALGLSRNTFCGRLIAARLVGITIPDPSASLTAKGRSVIEVINGKGLIGSDAHYWPGEISTGHRAFVHFCKKFKKELAFVVMNGDATDLSRISRHPPPGWTRMPETKDELEVTGERLHDIALAAGKGVPRFWPWGNHDQRYEVYLASHAAEVAGIKGMRLQDHFPDWEPCWSVFVNNRPGGLVIKHRFKGGIYAARNNALMSGRSIVTGHLHAQQIIPHTDYNGTIWGVDAGCIADTYGPQFAYLEDNARSWRSGFALVSFKDGVLMPPELITVLEPGAVAFRGEIIEV